MIGRGGTICEIKIHVQELRLKTENVGGIIREEGVYVGRYGTNPYIQR